MEMEPDFAHASDLDGIIADDANRPVIAVLHGGQSPDAADHSLESARSVAGAATAYGYEAHLVDANSTSLPTLVDKIRPDRAVLTLADVPSDAGSIQGLLNHLDIIYVGSGVAGCSLAAHPLTARRVLRNIGVPVPAHGEVRAHLNPYDEAQRITDEASAATARSRPATGAWDIRIQPLSPPDPHAFGEEASAWTCSAATPDALADLIARAAPYTPLMYECDIVGQTLWIGILDDEDDDRPYTLPPRDTGQPPADTKTVARARHLALRAHRALNLRGLSVHRFTRYRATRLVWREVHTHPDLAPTGLLAEMAAAYHGWSYPQFIDHLLGSATADAKEAGGA